MADSNEQKIEKFIRFVTERQIGIADEMAGHFQDQNSHSVFKESGYAILAIAMVYFEMIANFLNGSESKASRNSFREGFRAVYWLSSKHNDVEINDLYDAIRCGMYHMGMTRRTYISRFFLKGFELVDGQWHVNPAKVVSEIKIHFDEYSQMLMNAECTFERTNFLQVYSDQHFEDHSEPLVVSSEGHQTLTTPNPMERA